MFNGLLYFDGKISHPNWELEDIRSPSNGLIFELIEILFKELECDFIIERTVQMSRDNLTYMFGISSVE